MAKLSLRVPMRWSDLDAYGHVNNARMLTILEEARIKTFWQSRLEMPDVDADLLAAARVLTGDGNTGTHTLVAGQRIEYTRILEWTGEDVRVDLWLGAIGGASLEVCYEVFTAGGELVAKATTSMVVVDAETARPHRIPEAHRAELSKLVDQPVTFRR